MPKVFNLGSINIDRTISVPRFPLPGETLAGGAASEGLGGKGLNISVALHRAGLSVCHIGAVDQSDQSTRDQVVGLGLSTAALERSYEPTGQAFILLDAAKENLIVVSAGANGAISETHIELQLAAARPGDWLVLQNETNNQEFAVNFAKSKGMKVGLVPAPFDADMVRALASKLDLLVLNEIEAEQMEQALGVPVALSGVPRVVVTKGAQGATLLRDVQPVHTQGLPVTPVDTTAAGDTFFGFFLGALLSGLPDKDALCQANAAAALAVQTLGATASIPTLQEVEDFRQKGKEK